MSKALKTYSVTGRLDLIVSIDVRAENLTAALLDSGKLKEQDFVKILGEWADGKLKILGVSDNVGWSGGILSDE